VSEQWLTTREAAQLLGLRDLEWVRHQLRERGVRYRRFGPSGRIRWLAADVDRVFPVAQARVSMG